MPTTFSGVVESFRTDIEEIRQSVRLVATRRQVRNHAQATLRMDSTDKSAKKLIDDFLSANPKAEEAVLRGLYVHMGSIFEHFIRGCLEEIVAVSVGKATRYEELSETLRNRHLHLSGQALQRIYQGVSGRKINYHDIARRLGTCVIGNEAFELNKECFTLFLGNCTSDRVLILLKSVGVSGNVWEEVGRDGGLRQYFGGGGVRETKKLTVRKLDDYIQTRNGIVHRGELYKSISESELGGTVEFFFRLCSALSSVLDRRL